MLMQKCIKPTKVQNRVNIPILNCKYSKTITIQSIINVIPNEGLSTNGRILYCSFYHKPVTNTRKYFAKNMLLVSYILKTEIEIVAFRLITSFQQNGHKDSNTDISFLFPKEDIPLEKLDSEA